MMTMTEEPQVKKVDITYNSEHEELIIPEFGRSVQKLIQHAKTLEDKEYRQAFVERVAKLMMQLTTFQGDKKDHEYKVWQNIFRIAKYDLDVEAPVEIVEYTEMRKRPEAVEYPEGVPRYSHYGFYIQEMIKKAIEMEDADIKDQYTRLIGGYMMIAYKEYSNANTATEERIWSDMRGISEGKIEIPEDMTLPDLDGPTRGGRGRSGRGSRRGSNRSSRSGGRSRNNRSSNSGGSNSSRGRSSRSRRGNYRKKR